jgi:hypothetical protein
LLKEKLGFDYLFNYKEETDLNSALTRLETSKLVIQGMILKGKKKQFQFIKIKIPPTPVLVFYSTLHRYFLDGIDKYILTTLGQKWQRHRLLMLGNC